jgi:hypothetical protein
MTTNNPDDLIRKGDLIEALQKDFKCSVDMLQIINSIPAARSDKGEAVALYTKNECTNCESSGRVVGGDYCTDCDGLGHTYELYLAASQQAIPAGWVDENAAWIDSNNEKSEDGVYTAGISTPYHGHVIQCHADSEDEANELCKIVFDALSAAPTAPIDNGVKKHER